MRLSRLAIVLLPLALAGCGIPDLVATGVKSYENRPGATPDQAGATAQPAAATVQPVAAPPAAPKVEPIPASAPIGGMAPPEPVTVEPLK